MNGSNNNNAQTESLRAQAEIKNVRAPANPTAHETIAENNNAKKTTEYEGSQHSKTD